MTPDPNDMSTPVTRGELRAELATFEQKLDQKLEIWAGALRAHIAESERRLLAELARHYKAIQEALSKQISVIDDKYRDLPARVRKLEARVFTPRRR